MNYMENRFVIRYLFTSCKIRRLVTVVAAIVCSILFIKIVHRRFHENKDGSGEVEYMSNELSGGGRGIPKDLPGYFLRGKQPSMNGSYCSFNYGLPTKLDWSLVEVVGTPQLGRKSPYRVIYNAIVRTMYNASYSKDHVTYATHVTPEFLYHIVEIARYWDGPISVTAFVPDYDLGITMRLFSHLCRCFDGMAKISLHLAFPMQDRPRFMEEGEQRLAIMKRRKHKRQSDVPLMNNTVSTEAIKKLNTTNTHSEVKSSAFVDSDMPINFFDCSMPDLGQLLTYRNRHGLIYPVNVGRNVAKNASTTQYSLVSDVEIIPSEDLATKFIIMIKRHKSNGRFAMIPKWRLAFVLPLFEVESGEDLPRNKSSLQQLYADGKAVYFHRWVCTHCQKIPELQRWIKEDPGKIMKPFAITKRQFPYHRWEPLYISTKHTPLYSETLSWEGKQDKMTQMLEMCLKSYDFVIVNGGFLCHSPGIKSKPKHRKSWRSRHELVNTKQYDLIVKSLASRYPVNPKCRLA